MIKRYTVVAVVVGVLVSFLASVALSQEPAETGMQLLRSDASGVTIDFTSPKYSIEKTELDTGSYDRIVMEDVSLTGESGSPQMPVATALIGVPPTANVSLRVMTESSTQLEGQFSLAPAPSAAPLEDDLQPGQKQYDVEPAVYERDAFYPQEPARVADDAWLRDQRIVRVEVYPFQYNPVTGALRHDSHLRIELTFDGGEPETNSEAGAVEAETSPFESSLRANVLNYETARDWRATPAPAQAVEPLSSVQSGTRYKLVVDEDGLYKVTPGDLQAAGMAVNSVNPASFHMTSQGHDVAIHVKDDGDSAFEAGEYILFYGQKFNGERMAQTDAAQDLFWLVDQCEQTPQRVFCPPYIDKFDKDYAAQLRKYTDDNVYWLSAGGSAGPRMAEIDGSPSGTASTPAYYIDTVRAEESNEWYTHHFSGPDTWFWKRILPGFDGMTTTYTTTLSAIASAPVSATVRSEIASRNDTIRSNQFYLNDLVDPLADKTWFGKTNLRIEAQVPQSALRNGENELRLVNNENSMYFNWFEIEYARQFVAQGNQLTFSYSNAGTREYNVQALTGSSVTVLDITDPLTPRRIISPDITGSPGAYTAGFEVTQNVTSTYLVAGNSAIKQPKTISRVGQSSLPGTEADYIFITHPDLYTETQKLATYRANHGYSTVVADIFDVYDAFGDGIETPLAIKNYLSYAYNNWSTAPTHVLLVGGGNWNFKGYGVDTYGIPSKIYMPPNLAFVDPWQGEVDSTNLLATIVGDDILPDINIARLPVTSEQELTVVVDKIIAYEQANTQAPQAWQQRVTFAADNGDNAGDFANLSENIITDHLTSGVIPNRIYLDDYFATGECGVQDHRCEQMANAITRTLNYTGSAILNYIGHAGIYNWAHENVLAHFQAGSLKYEDTASLANGDRMPVLLSMDCLDGYWIHPDPSVRSLAVRMLTLPDAGVPAAFSPSGLGVATGHDALHRGFYDATYGNGNWMLGPATYAAKVALFSSGDNYDLLNTFTLFGDPAMRVATPYRVHVTPTAASGLAHPGQVAEYTLSVKNTGLIKDSFSVMVTNSAWNTALTKKTVGPLGAGESADVVVQVTVPANATDGTSASTRVRVRSKGDTSRVRIVTLTTTAVEEIFGTFLPLVAR